MKDRVVVRTLADLGDALTLAPERYRAAALEDGGGKTLGALVVERNERVVPTAIGDAIVLDTTHARDGVLDIASALRARKNGELPESAKKRVCAGDVLVSRLRPYLRQIAFAHPAAMGERAMVCSMEFFVLSPRDGSLAYLLPWLLRDRAQATLAAAQEGGHHPRVPRDSLLGMRVPKAVTAKRAVTSRAVEAALAELYRAGDAYTKLLTLG